MRTLQIAILALGLSMPGAASADAFCDGLKAIAAAGTGADPFKVIRGTKGDDGAFAGKRLLPGFDQCRTDTSSWPQYACHRMGLNAASAEKLEAATKSSVEACFGGTMFRDEDRALEPYALRLRGSDYPVVLVNKVGAEMVSVTYIVKK